MMNRIFGRNETVEERVAALESRISEQNRSLMVAGTAVIELEKVIENLRKYNEGMELRILKQNNELKDAMQAGFEKAIELVKSEIMALGEQVKPAEVVKAIDNRSREEKIIRRFDAIKARMDKVVAQDLMHDIPLVSKGVYKNPTFTPSGERVYDAVTEFNTNLAKVCGVKKEFFTNRKRYDDFFKRWQIKPYDKISVRTRDGRTNRTVLSAIIAGGHVRQYIEYLYGIYLHERRKYE